MVFTSFKTHLSVYATSITAVSPPLAIILSRTTYLACRPHATSSTAPLLSLAHTIIISQSTWNADREHSRFTRPGALATDIGKSYNKLHRLTTDLLAHCSIEMRRGQNCFCPRQAPDTNQTRRELSIKVVEYRIEGLPNGREAHECIGSNRKLVRGLRVFDSLETTKTALSDRTEERLTNTQRSGRRDRIDGRH